MSVKKFVSTKDFPVAETKYGKLRGVYFDGIFSFLGIRYAQAKRFEMPQEPESWEGIRDAKAYGCVCPLLESPAPSDEVLVPHRFWPESEDCLNLQIWTSSMEPEKKQPVMVWFHGGGFVAGSAIEHIAYEGDELAKRYGVTVVNVNHRLNAFGYLDMSAYHELYANSVNAGIADLTAALRWVKENIASFGGDPGNVTIFGQSGGGMKVTSMGQCPASDGLFHKAIIMSGIFPSDLFGASVSSKEVARRVLKALHIPADEGASLAEVPVDIFKRGVNTAIQELRREGKYFDFQPQPNFWYAGDPLKVGFRKSYGEIPTMVGTVMSEFSHIDTDKTVSEMSEEDQLDVLKKAFGAEKADSLASLYKKAYPGKPLIYAGALDVTSRPETVKYAKAKAESGSAPVFMYNFAVDFDYNGGRSAWHCADIPYFFANAEKIPYCWSQEGTERLNEELSGAFVNFARTGDPNGSGLPEWHPVSDGKVPTMVLDVHSEERTDYDDELISKAAECIVPFSVVKMSKPVEEEKEGKDWIY